MPSTVVHLAFSGLLAAALLGSAFDRRSVAVVLLVTAFPDLDAFVALYTTVGHRAALHNVWIPAFWTALLWVDVTLRDRSFVRERWGEWGVRVVWVSAVCYVLSALALDIVNGVLNPLWPVHDQFYHIDGKLELSDQRGIVQTFIETGGEDGSGIPAPESIGSSDEVNLSTGVNPDPSGTEEDPERLFPVFRAGWELMLFVVGTTVTAARFALDRRRTAEE
jgi:hypothetical protein